MSYKRWEQDGNKHTLYFTPYYEEIIAATVYEEDDGGWCFDSEVTKCTGEYLGSDTLNAAKSDVENLLADHYQSEIDYYTEVLRHFEEN